MPHVKIAGVVCLFLMCGCAPIGSVSMPLPDGGGPSSLMGELPADADPRAVGNHGRFARYAGSRFWGNGRLDDQRAGTGGNTTLLIDALPGGHTYRPTDRPVLVARMINRGPTEDRVYGTSADANFVYYVVARRDSINAAFVKWEMYQVHLRTNSVSHHRSGYIWRCHYGNASRPPGLSGRASFLRFESGEPCAPRPAPVRGDGKTIPFHAPVTPGLTNTDSGWFACDGNGCCTFDNNPYAY